MRTKLSNEKRAPGCLGCIGDEILPNYMGILISQYKDPDIPTSIMESNKGFFVAQMCFSVKTMER